MRLLEQCLPVLVYHGKSQQDVLHNPPKRKANNAQNALELMH